MNPSIGYLRTCSPFGYGWMRKLQEAAEQRETGPESILSWRKEFLREFEETDAKERPLGNLPVVVVSSGPVASDAGRRSREGAAARLDFLSSNTMHSPQPGAATRSTCISPIVWYKHGTGRH